MIYNLGSGAAAPELTGIAVTAPPTKTTYYKGDSFATSGMIVTAYFDDGSSSVVTGYTYSPTTIAATTTSVTISYTHEDITKTTTVPVKVNVYLYKSGTTDSSVGGWNFSGSNASAQSTYLALRSSSMMYTGNTNSMSSNNKIDLTACKQLSFTMNYRIIDYGGGDYMTLYVGVTSSQNTGTFVAQYSAQIGTLSGTYTVDVSSLSGSYYISAYLKYNGSDNDAGNIYVHITQIESKQA